uniref:RNA (Guanine-9-)-methyltransferase domain-containing protein 3 n=1 Tax=Ascaris suum TaxID=6253 RepID=F1KXJ4_ASCSU
MAIRYGCAEGASNGREGITRSSEHKGSLSMTGVAVREVDSLIKTSGGDGTIGSDESFVDFCEQFDALLRPIDAETVIVDWQNDRVNRKQTRYKKVLEYRRLKRKEERKRRRLRKTNSNVECFHLDSHLNIIVDLGFTEAMNEKEMGKLVRQMGRVWGLQKRYVGLKTTLLSPCGKFLEEARRVLTGFNSFQWNVSFTHIAECSNNPLIYLSPDASIAPLEFVSPSVTYVIGGIVDESGAGSLSKDKAESLDIEVRRLPIVEYMRRSEHGTFNIMLAINQVVEVLVRYAYCKRWDESLAAVVPKRSGYVPIST